MAQPPTPESIARHGKRRHEISLAGFIFLGITAFIMIAAINSDTNTLYIAFGLMLGGLIISGLLSTLSLRKVEVKRIMADHVVAGEPAEIQYPDHQQEAAVGRALRCVSLKSRRPRRWRRFLKDFGLHIPAGRTEHVDDAPRRLAPRCD